MNECTNKYSLVIPKDITDYKTSFFLEKRCMYNEHFFFSKSAPAPDLNLLLH